MLSSTPVNNQQLSVALDRLALYLSRVRDDLRRGDRNQALANLAELTEISRRLWNRLAALQTRQTRTSASSQSD
jgi:hypothetical protein